MTHMLKLTGDTSVDLPKIAAAFRLASNEVARASLLTSLNPQWSEGFEDGLKFCGVCLDAFAKGQITQEQFEEAMNEMTKGKE